MSALEAAYMRGKHAGYHQARADILKLVRKWFFMDEDVRDCVKEIRALEPAGRSDHTPTGTTP